MEYEKEYGQVINISVPVRALARIVGRQGATIRELQDDTKAEIDVNKNDAGSSAGSSTLTLKGTKQAVAAAKKAINSIVADVQDESTIEVSIERPLHMTIIGKGGQNIRDLIARCGGPSDAKAAGSLVRFPRAGEDTSDTVTIRAPTVLAEKIKAELEKQAASLRDRVVYGVVVPQSAHARLIGRGGVGVNELQKKYDIKILLPNSSWKEASNGGEVANKEELGEFADSDLIKLLGSQSACEAAATEISQKAASAPQRANASKQQRRQSQLSDQPTKTVMVPSHLHTRIVQGGRIFRALPSGVRIDHGDVKPPTTNQSGSAPATNGGGKSVARIDEESEDPEFVWEVVSLSEERGESPDIPWNIRGNDQAKVDEVEASIHAALERSQKETHQGTLTVPQPLIPRIVGRGGSGLDKLRSLGVSAEIEGRQGANSVIFIGTPETLEKAREAVMELSQSQRSNRR
ncbi:MAG: hypothetical protein CYPHOPRED_004144 [Cyphobasidiales sp. Tagirdzhanova-0007]|nr:MAG: hypothetical protein CYPHOPRED_004144 [Cyphobasidiales sp. Tagirdzhanova-0007]